MQAPTAPGESSAQEPTSLTCPSCSASNGKAAAFCWQCFRPFAHRAAMPAPPGPAGRGYGPAQRVPVFSPTEPIPAPAPSRNLGGMVSVIVLTLAVIAGVVFFATRGGGVELPTSFAGLERLENEQVAFAVDQFRAAADTQGVEGDMAIYGSSGFPTAALVWIRDASVPTSDEAFTAFSSGFNTGLPGGLDPTRRSSSSVNGTDYVCASVASVPPAAMCLWQTDEIFWMLFDLAGAGRVQAVQELAVAAHDTVA